MSSEWSQTTLGEALAFQRGHDLPEGERKPGIVPIIGSAGHTGWHNQALANGPGVTIGRSGSSAGLISFVEQDYWPHNACLYVTDFKGNDPHFCFYLLQTLDLPRFVVGSAQPSLNRNHLYSVPVRLPGLREQQVISSTIGSLEKKAKLNRQMADTLEAIARALFQSWFVDFDPVLSAAAGEDTGLPAHTAALFPKRLMEDGLPEGWRWGSISDYAAVNPPTKLSVESTAPYVEMAALPTRGSRISKSAMRVPGSGARFKNGDTLIARITPCLENGKSALVNSLPEATVGWGSTEFIVLRPHSHVSRALPYIVARHASFRAHLIAAMSGTSGRQRVQAAAVDRWRLAVPPEQVMNLFAKLADPIFERLRHLGEENDTLATLLDTLLPKLVSGVLRVRDAEKLAESA